MSQKGGRSASSSREKEPGWIQLGFTRWQEERLLKAVQVIIYQVILPLEMRKYGKVSFEGTLKLGPESMPGTCSGETDDSDPS